MTVGRKGHWWTRAWRAVRRCAAIHTQVQPQLLSSGNATYLSWPAPMDSARELAILFKVFSPSRARRSHPNYQKFGGRPENVYY